MELSKVLREKIEERFGEKITYPRQCMVLAQSIEDALGNNLKISETSLKRMFGMVGDANKVVQRKSTMDILAMYLGYDNFDQLCKDLGNDEDISAFCDIDMLKSSETENGTQIQITYKPNRLLVLTYIGNNQYVVNEAQNSKLIKGDLLTITSMAIGFEFLVADVVREGVSLGAYHGAKEGGLTSITVIN